MARHDQRAPTQPYRPVGYGLPTVLAVGLHVLVVVLSVVTLPQRQPEDPQTSSIVQATLVSTETTTDQAQRAEEARSRAAARQAEEEAQQAEAEARERAEEELAAEETARQAEQEVAEREAEARQRDEAREAAEAEARRRAEEAERQAQLREEQEAQRQRQQEEAAEAQRQAEEEARRQQEAEAQRRAEEEARRQREAEEQRRAEEEARRQREAEEQRRREEEARRAAEEASQGLERAIEGESEAVANARQAQEAANSFINLVRRAVEQAWVIPPGATGNLEATIQVQLGPSGELFGTSIIQSSGDSSFDRSAIQAVEAAAPFGELRQLPATAQRDFRQFNLRFRPGDVR